MRTPIILFALVAAATPAVAQPASGAATPVMANATSAVVTAAPVAPTKGQMLIGADHSRLGAVVDVEDDGSVGIIFDAHMVTIPASTLKMADGRLMTSLSKHELTQMQ